MNYAKYIKALFYVKKGSEKPNGSPPLMCRLTMNGEIKTVPLQDGRFPTVGDVKGLTADRLQTFSDGNLCN